MANFLGGWGRKWLGLRDLWLRLNPWLGPGGLETTLEDDGYTGIGRYCILIVFSFWVPSLQVPLGMNCL